MLWVLSWLVYGLVVGIIAKLFDQSDAPTGFLPTLGLGVLGSFVGGFIEYLMGHHQHPFSSSGIIMGIIGAVICLFAWRGIKTWMANNNNNNMGS